MRSRLLASVEEAPHDDRAGGHGRAPGVGSCNSTCEGGPVKTVDSKPLTPDEIERYGRHILLPEIGGAGQQ